MSDMEKQAGEARGAACEYYQCYDMSTTPEGCPYCGRSSAAVPAVPVPPADLPPSEGTIFYDGMHYLFLNTKKGPAIFAEIRGNGTGLPMDANAQRICDLWNAALAAEVGE